MSFGFVREGEVVDERGFDYEMSEPEKRENMRENGQLLRESTC